MPASGGRLLAVQMFQVRKQTAWLLTAGDLERFRSTTVSTLLMGETIRKLQAEGIQRMVVPSAASVREIGQCQEMPRINVRIYPWSYRSLMAMMIGAGRTWVRSLLRPCRQGSVPVPGGAG